MGKKLVLFIEDGLVDGKIEFKKGETYELPVESGSYDRWIKRKKCIDAHLAEKAPAKPVESEKSEEHTEQESAPENKNKKNRSRHS